jgi:hypothetical protein
VTALVLLPDHLLSQPAGTVLPEGDGDGSQQRPTRELAAIGPRWAREHPEQVYIPLRRHAAAWAAGQAGGHRQPEPSEPQPGQWIAPAARGPGGQGVPGAPGAPGGAWTGGAAPPPAPPQPRPAVAAEPPTTPGGLPRRVPRSRPEATAPAPQGSAVAEESPPAEPPVGEPPTGPGGRSLEEIREALSSYQSGLRRAREASASARPGPMPGASSEPFVPEADEPGNGHNGSGRNGHT